MKECSEYLSDWQAGFRPERGCRDTILLLRVLFDQALDLGEELVDGHLYRLQSRLRQRER